MVPSKILPLDDPVLDQMMALYQEENYQLTLSHYHDEELYLNLVYCARKLQCQDSCLRELPLKQEVESYLEETAERMGLRVRRVLLDAPGKVDLSGTLVFEAQTQKSYVVENTFLGGQRLYDAQTQQSVPFEKVSLLPYGFYVYRPFSDQTTSFARILKDLLHVVRADMMFFGVFMMVGSLLGLLMPMVMGVVLDFVIPYGDVPLLGKISLALLVLSGLVYLSALGQSGMFIRLKSRGVLYTLSGIWGRVFVLPLSFFRKFTVGDLSLRLKGVDLVSQEMTVSLISMISSMTFTFFGMLIIGFYSVSFALWTLGVGLVLGAFFMMTAYRQMGFARQIMALQSQIQTRLFQLVKNILPIKITRSEAHVLQNWRKLFLLKMRQTIRLKRFENLFGAGTSFLSIAMTIVVFLVLLQEKDLSFGTLVMLLSLYTQLVGAMTSWMLGLLSFVRFKPYLERVAPVLHTPPESRGTIVLPTLTGEIRFQDVCFSYMQEEHALFSDLSFEIPAGHFVALVGASGVGKSTLMKLILGLESPQAGSIFMDGTPLNRLDLQDLRRHIGVVLQTPAFIPGSILDNVSMMDSRLSITDVWRALRQASLEEDVARLSMGLFTPVSELGKSFSSGQIQRLMIARALVRAPKVLLFDEPTSALDNVTQNRIMDTLRSLSITRVVSAHRFSTIEKADQIFVLEGGRLVEQGTYGELSYHSRIFKKLLENQTVV